NKIPSVYLLPAFDEFIISYKDRSASLLLEDHKKAVSINGLFRPLIVVDGKVSGLWKRTVKKERVLIETELFKLHSQKILRLMEKSANAYGDFLGKKAETAGMNSI